MLSCTLRIVSENMLDVVKVKMEYTSRNIMLNYPFPPNLIYAVDFKEGRSVITYKLLTTHPKLFHGHHIIRL